VEIPTLAEACTWSTTNLTSFWIPAVVGAIGGIVGGLAECATHVKITSGKVMYDTEEMNAASIRVLRRSSALIGWAGGWAVLFIFVATRWWEHEAGTNSLSIFVLTLSVASGFGARRLLPQLADRLKKQIEETSLKVEQVEKNVQAAQGEVKAVMETSNRIDLLSRARAAHAIPTSTAGDVFKSIEELRGLMKADPLDREVVIVLGNLLAKAKQLPAAIAALTRFVDAKAAAEQNDTDLSDVLFNRACYNALLWKQAGVEAHAAEEYRRRAIKDCEVSFRLSPANRKEAELDRDLAPLMQDADYQAMLKSLDGLKPTGA
jgi:tetratricopeptide (TPR) repeat protein